MHPFLLAVAILTSAILAVGGPVTQRSPTVCNGHAELCGRSYSNITFAGGTSRVFPSPYLVFPRAQEVSIPQQLSLGIRMLQSQSHMGLFDGQIHLCHTSCVLYDGGTVLAYLKLVATFLNANPNEVVTLLITNPEGLSFQNQWAPVFQAANVIQWAYVPPLNPMPINAWPTLGEMITNNQRLVIFIDYVGKDGTLVNYLIPEFQTIWETPYDATNDSFPCSIDRIRGTLPPSEQMYLINHYLEAGEGSVLFSDPVDAPTINSVPSIIANADECVPLGNGRNPNFILMDYVDLGSPLAAVNQLNGLA
ncbi:PLC-like phosphodiesterase [Lactarius tabidus]